MLEFRTFKKFRITHSRACGNDARSLKAHPRQNPVTKLDNLFWLLSKEFAEMFVHRLIQGEKGTGEVPMKRAFIAAESIHLTL